MNQLIQALSSQYYLWTAMVINSVTAHAGVNCHTCAALWHLTIEDNIIAKNANQCQIYLIVT